MNEGENRKEGGREREGSVQRVSDPVTLPCLLCVSLSLSLSSYRNRTYPLPRVSIYHPSLSPSCVFVNLDPPSKIWIRLSSFELGHLTLPLADPLCRSLPLVRRGKFAWETKSFSGTWPDYGYPPSALGGVGNGFFCMGKKRSRDGLVDVRGWRIRDWKSEDSRLVFELFIIGGECHQREEGRFVSIFHLFG